MIDPSCAALDPIFWLHHANIDRLWNRWVAQGRQNPTDAAWLTQRFTFYDEDGNPITIACADVVNTATQLEYDYDDATQQQILETMDTSEPRGERPPELVAASAREVDFKGQPVSVPLNTTAGAVAGLSSDAVAAGAPEGIYLNVEDIEAAENPGVVYGVYPGECRAHTPARRQRVAVRRGGDERSGSRTRWRARLPPHLRHHRRRGQPERRGRMGPCDDHRCLRAAEDGAATRAGATGGPRVRRTPGEYPESPCASGASACSLRGEPCPRSHACAPRSAGGPSGPLAWPSSRRGSR